MKIYISDSFTAACDSDNILGRIGETNSRTVEVEQPDVEGADSYRLRFCYDDDVIYDVPLNNGELTVSASLLRYAGIVNCVWIASKALGEGYQLVAKSNSVALEIQASTDGSEAVPAPEVQTNLLDKCQEYANSALNACGQAESFANSSDEKAQISKASAEESKAYEQSAKNFSEQAKISANNALSSENSAKEYSETAAAKADEVSSAAASAQNSAESASQSATSASTSAATATQQAEIATLKATEISDNAAQIQKNKTNITDLQNNKFYISKAGYVYKQNAIVINGFNGAVPEKAFQDCINMTGFTIPDSITSIGKVAFQNCTALTNITIPDTVTSLAVDVFRGCNGLQSASVLCSGITSKIDIFKYCTALTDIALCEDFNASFVCDTCKNLKADSMVSMFENLKDLSGQTAKTLTLGSTNLAKLNDEQKQIATNKNWNLA
ncbi:MAG: leucine-rich repeat domain-containing protein [Oscillospiraceae bacterium]